ncbi:ATP synthase B/B' CF family protein [Mycobacterium xenopi 3993]|nr:ATP synthase B/B' CF family protein [Mycobacterium xenopi 3993]
MLIIFLIVLGVIGTFVVPPITKVLREREFMVDKTLADNRRADEQFAAARADYENAMAQARLEASAIRDGARAEGRKVLEEMRARAEEEVNATLQSAGEQLKRAGDAIAADLRSHVETMSATLASRILGVDIASAASARSEQ